MTFLRGDVVNAIRAHFSAPSAIKKHEPLRMLDQIRGNGKPKAVAFRREKSRGLYKISSFAPKGQIWRNANASGVQNANLGFHGNSILFGRAGSCLGHSI